MGRDRYPGHKEGERRIIVRIRPEHIQARGLD
jgi:hypothetical protein